MWGRIEAEDGVDDGLTAGRNTLGERAIHENIYSDFKTSDMLSGAAGFGGLFSRRPVVCRAQLHRFLRRSSL